MVQPCWRKYVTEGRLFGSNLKATSRPLFLLSVVVKDASSQIPAPVTMPDS